VHGDTIISIILRHLLKRYNTQTQGIQIDSALILLCHRQRHTYSSAQGNGCVPSTEVTGLSILDCCTTIRVWKLLAHRFEIEWALKSAYYLNSKRGYVFQAPIVKLDYHASKPHSLCSTLLCTINSGALTRPKCPCPATEADSQQVMVTPRGSTTLLCLETP
jgi:hypothetical protein